MAISYAAWPYRTTLGIQHGQVYASQTNYPLLLCSDNLPGYIFDRTNPYACSPTGACLRFSSDSVGATQLAQEVVHFKGVAGGVNSGANAEIWVNVPSLSNTSDTTIYMWHGNPDATALVNTDPYGRNAVWTPNGDTSAVWHLDHTSFANSVGITLWDGTNSGALDGTGSWTGSQSAKFDGTTTYINVNALKVTPTITVSAIAQDQSSNQYGKIISKTWHSNAAPYVEYALIVDNSYPRKSRTEIDTTSVQYTATGSAIATPNNFTWQAMTYDRTTLKLYQNGVLTASTSAGAGSGAIGATTNVNTNIGRGSFDSTYVAQYFKGLIDEGRIFTSAKSIGWLACDYSSQNSPSSFVKYISTPTYFRAEDMFPMVPF